MDKKEKKSLYDREYRKRPSVIEKRRKRVQSEEYKRYAVEYRKRPKVVERRKEQSKEWREKNKSHILNYERKPDVRKRKYLYFKKEDVKVKNKIRSKTNLSFPITNQKCKCGALADCHHHTTNPYQVDKFNYMCNKCHIKLHGEIQND